MYKIFWDLVDFSALQKSKQKKEIIIYKCEEADEAKQLLTKRMNKKFQDSQNEKKIMENQKLREKQLKNYHQTFSLFLKNLTSSIIVRIAEGVFQSIISIGACICYVVNTYYEDSQLLKFFFF